MADQWPMDDTEKVVDGWATMGKVNRNYTEWGKGMCFLEAHIKIMNLQLI